jgi:pyridoxine 5-phosphate synthase
VTRLVLVLDAAAAFRDVLRARDDGLLSAALLAELAGVDAVRIGISEEQRPVCDADVLNLRRAVRGLELRMPASQTLLKLALEVRPDRVILAGDTRDSAGAVRPVDPRAGRDSALAQVVRGLEEAGIEVAARIHSDLEAVKAAHTLGLVGIELYTGDLLDLPSRERGAELERLGDAARLAAKLRIAVGVGGGVDFANVEEIRAAAPVAERMAVGRALIGRAMLVGIDRSVRDFRSQLT